MDDIRLLNPASGFRVAVLLLVVGWASGIDANDDHPDGTLYAINVDGTNARMIATFPGYPTINSPEVSPDGNWVGVDGWKADQGSRDARLLFVNLETSEVRTFGSGCMPSWSSDGKRFAFCSYVPHGVYICDFESKQRHRIDRMGWGIQLSPDGHSAVYSMPSGQIVIYNLTTNQKRPLFEENDLPFKQIYWNCKWSPDSDQVCILGVRPDDTHEIAVIDVEETDGPPNLQRLCDADAFNPDIGWHPDRPFITVAGKDARIQRINFFGAGQPEPFPGQPADRANSGNCWTRDGRTMIFVSTPRPRP